MFSSWFSGVSRLQGIYVTSHATAGKGKAAAGKGKGKAASGELYSVAVLLLTYLLVDKHCSKHAEAIAVNACAMQATSSNRYQSPYAGFVQVRHPLDTSWASVRIPAI